ncbi:hypothetical protein D9611_014243 [Ephemerocybe angulata]|uniref:WDR90 4th beta-propeller domain-containing protein n=1 Tax=Ephemerocybe angulata TaxID=980116 RepID=A0A8H5B9H3_9AGAR|nr:hypothetical protein D9611_014243 [Tulosesus angulatus]
MSRDSDSEEEFGAVASGPTLEEQLATITKERDDLAAKYALLLQEKGAPKTLSEAILGPKDGSSKTTLVQGLEDGSDDSTLGPKGASHTQRRTRRQRLLDTIDSFSARLLTTIAELDREALDVAHECEATRQEFEAASAELKDAESRFAVELENEDAVVEEYSRLRKERDTFEEQERSLTAELDGPRNQSVVVGKRQRLAVRLQQAQANLKETEGWMETTESDYQRGCQKVERAAAEVEKLKSIVQRKERELGEWLVPEFEWFTKELENFRALQSSISSSLDAMRGGLDDGWEGKLGDNAVFLEGLGGYTVHPDMVAHPTNWAPAIESFYLSQVSLALSKEMTKFHSAVLQRLKIQEGSAQREWRKGVEALFGQPAPSFKKSSLPQLIPLAEGPEGDVHEDPVSPSEEPGAGIPLPDLPPPPPPLRGHTNAVMSVAFSSDGSKIISGSIDKTVRVWDASSGNVQSVLEGHSAYCTSVAVSGDGSSWIASGSRDKTVRIWDSRTGKVQRVLAGHTGAVNSIAFSWNGSRICSGSDDKTVRVWNASTGVVQSVLEGHPASAVRSVAISRDGMRIVSGGLDGTIRVWDASSTTCSLRKVLQGHTRVISSVAFSRDGTWIVSGSSDQTVRVWDASTGNVVRILEGHAGTSTSIAISPDGKKVVSGSSDGTVLVWDALTGKLESVLEGHSNSVWSVAFSPDGRRVASGAFDNTIRLWNLSAPTSLSPPD